MALLYSGFATYTEMATAGRGKPHDAPCAWPWSIRVRVHARARVHARGRECVRARVLLVFVSMLVLVSML